MKVFRFNIALIFLLLAFQLANGQNPGAQSDPSAVKTDERIENLKKQARELYAAYAKSDFEKFLEVTHPKVIEMVGGREVIISMMRKIADDMPKIFESSSISHTVPDKLVEIDRQLFAVVPQKIEGTTHNKRKVVQEGCVVGISDDGGKTWRFVGGEKFDELFPSLAGKIAIVKEKTIVDGVEQ